MRPLKIILLPSAFNGLTQRVWLEWLRIGLVGLRWSVDFCGVCFSPHPSPLPDERGLNGGYWRFTQT
jgi:hypothetical protein